ncbi:MAG: anthranilate phosphoribosyltransferase [Desulfovibrio sp.]|jgi:anthranilate synthase/phosphoribosyltransferase|nr:anthranilate phosphoribosyltransferase [Desulfovibrio sp.]
MFLIIDNYDSFTYNLVQAFHGLGVTPKLLRNDDPALLSLAGDPSLEAVCLSPGPGHPDKAGLCLDFLAALPQSVPVLGVCLGHQVLARFAGLEVSVARNIVHGKASDITHDGRGLFRGLPSPMRVGRYHSLLALAGDDERRVRVTARSPEGEIMAIAYGDRPWYGVQFHPESVLTPDGVRLLGNFIALRDAEGRKDEADAGAKDGAGTTAEAPDAGGRDDGEPTPPRLSAIMEDLALGRDLTPFKARSAFSRLMDGEFSPAQAGAFLLGLRAKGETPEEMAEAVKAILDRAVSVAVPSHAPVLDVVGTGGDGKNSFNCSTGAALVLAALGHKILKHGNRSVSSRCGSADVLEGLGVPLDFPLEDIPVRLERDGFVFLFAPRFHPSFRHIMPIRRELGIRTLFNLLGPLVNPARPGVCFLGVADPAMLPLVANTLARLGGRSGAVVCGAGGYDELTCLGPARVAYVRGDAVRFEELDPAAYGFSPCDPEALAIEGPEQGVGVLLDLLNGGGPEAMRDMLAFNIGFGLHLLHPEKPVAACMIEAKKALAAGVGGRYLLDLINRKGCPDGAAVA